MQSCCSTHVAIASFVEAGALVTIFGLGDLANWHVPTKSYCEKGLVSIVPLAKKVMNKNLPVLEGWNPVEDVACLGCVVLSDHGHPVAHSSWFKGPVELLLARQ